MTEYTYQTYTLHWALPEAKAGDVEVDALTPAQIRELQKRWTEALDRTMLNELSGGYDVQVNRAGSKGVTIEHIRRTGAVVPNSR